MFTGIIETTGKIASVTEDASGKIFRVSAQFSGTDAKTGDSIALNGTCLTVAGIENSLYEFYASFKTLELTNLSGLVTGSKVNLERAMMAGERFGGHMVSGHVDCMGEVTGFSEVEKDVWRYSISVPEQFRKYIVERGSISVDGISLTIVSVNNREFELVIIPETIRATNVSDWKPGYRPNLEFDMMVRYVENLLKFR